MVSFKDGPAADVSLCLRRAPTFLRVVIDETDGRVDALDQLDDTPGPSEEIHVYRRDGDASAAHVCSRGRGPSGWYVMAEYRYLGFVPEAATRETGAWRRWCEQRAEAESTVGAT